MTTNAHAPMNCDEVTERSMDYMEGDVDPVTRTAMDAHLARCAACSALIADMRRIASAAAELPELTPSRDLWSGIAARIEAPVIALDARASQRRRRGPAWLRPAAAAAALMIATSSVTYYATRRAVVDSTSTAPTTLASTTPAAAIDSAPSTLPPAASAPNAATIAEPTGVGAPAVTAVSSRASSAASIRAGLTSADATYDREIKRLRMLIAQRRSQMDTATIAVIEKNLKIVDEAIAQCRAAIARDPNSRFLLENLNSALDDKVRLLRTAAMLPART